MYINLLRNKITNWNSITKCGFGWEFHAPLWTQTINNVQLTNVDAVQVMLIWNQNLLYNGDLSYTSSVLGTPEITNNTDQFDLYFLLASNIDINNYDEAEGHPISEGRIWELEKLMDCLKSNNIIDFCTGLENKYELTRWQIFGIPENFCDNNYIGFRVAVTLRNINL